MADLHFPQLTSGVVAHFPITKKTKTRTILNVSPDGSLTMLPDDGASRVTWEWAYTGLSLADVVVLHQFFTTCYGPLKPFTFMAPAGNLLADSSTFESESWQKSSLLKIAAQPGGPVPNALACTITNTAQVAQELVQTFAIPSSYQYCFSLYVNSQTTQTISLFRRGSTSEEIVKAIVGPGWKRIWTQGRLVDSPNSFSVGLRLSAGQQVSISAAQLEAQFTPSSYRATFGKGGIYQDAHWAVEELQIGCDAPNTFSIEISIETGS